MINQRRPNPALVNATKLWNPSIDLLRTKLLQPPSNSFKLHQTSIPLKCRRLQLHTWTMRLQANNFLIPFSRRRLPRLFLYKRNESHLSHKPFDTKGKEWRIDEKKIKRVYHVHERFPPLASFTFFRVLDRLSRVTLPDSLPVSRDNTIITEKSCCIEQGDVLLAGQTPSQVCQWSSMIRRASSETDYRYRWALRVWRWV